MCLFPKAESRHSTNSYEQQSSVLLNSFILVVLNAHGVVFLLHLPEFHQVSYSKLYELMNLQLMALL